MIEIKEIVHYDMDDFMLKINPEDIILLKIDRDQYYDRKSEDLGWFCDILHETSNGPVWDCYILGENYSPIEKLISSASNHLTKLSDCLYRNKKNSDDFIVLFDKKTQPALIFKDNYIVSKYRDLDFFCLIDACRYKWQRYELKLWQEAMIDFPDKNLREYFHNFNHFLDFVHKMNDAFKNEETRFAGVMFDICPELKEITKDASFETEKEIEAWAVRAGWL